MSGHRDACCLGRLSSLSLDSSMIPPGKCPWRMWGLELHWILRTKWIQTRSKHKACKWRPMTCRHAFFRTCAQVAGVSDPFPAAALRVCLQTACGGCSTLLRASKASTSALAPRVQVQAGSSHGLVTCDQQKRRRSGASQRTAVEVCTAGCIRGKGAAAHRRSGVLPMLGTCWTWAQRTQSL